MVDIDSIFINNYKLLFRIVYSYTRSIEDTKDILQDTFLKAYKASKEEILSSQLLPWLIVIAKNTTKTFLKKQKVTEQLDDYTYLFSNEPDFLNFTLYNALEGILYTIPQDVRIPIKNNLLDGIPLKKIAKDTKIPYSRLRYWSKKLLEDMRAIMKN